MPTILLTEILDLLTTKFTTIISLLNDIDTNLTPANENNEVET